MPHLQHTSIRYTVLLSDPGNFAKTAHVKLFELLDVFPVQGPALRAEQEGCEDDSTIDFHLCFQAYTMFAPQPVLESTEGCATLRYSCRDVVVHCDCVRQVASHTHTHTHPHPHTTV